MQTVDSVYSFEMSRLCAQMAAVNNFWCLDVLADIQCTDDFSEQHIYNFREWISIWSNTCSLTSTYIPDGEWRGR